MTGLATIAYLTLVLGATCYLLFAGADFGAGFWHLVTARRATRAGAEADRRVIEHVMGPVWEANHVWLIFVLVLAWTAFPPAFADVAGTYWIPISLAGLGLVARGTAFAFRKVVDEPRQRRWYAATFAVSSLVTPYCLGAVAGGVAARRGEEGALASWWNPTAMYAGLLTTALCVYLAAVYLTADARRVAGPGLAGRYRRRALTSGLVTGALAALGLAVVGVDAPPLLRELFADASLVLGLSATGGLASLALRARRRAGTARLTAALAAGSVLWAPIVAWYPHVLGPDQTVGAVAASDPVLRTVLLMLGLGALLLVPSFVWLYWLFQRHESREAS